MHEAYECTQLIKLTVQIESLAAYEDKLLVGTKQGHLMMYSITLKDFFSKPDVQLLRYNKTFSKKPIQQIAAIPEHEILLKLSDNLVCIHDLADVNFSLIKPLDRTKGATLFALEFKRTLSLTGKSNVMVRMCVATKRTLQLYYLKNRDLMPLASDINLPDVPRALEWCNDVICIGYKGSYSLVKLTDKCEITELFPTGKQFEPSVTKLSNNLIALGKDTQTKFINTEGGIESMTIKWSDLPIALAYDDPYFVCALREGVEVRSCCDEQTEVQFLNIQGAHLVTTARPGIVYIASPEHLWLVSQVLISKQIKTLLQEKRFELALKLANISDDSDEDKQKNVYQIQTLYAFDLFHNKKFDKSMDEFLKLDTDPYEVIRLFPSLLSQESSDTGIDDANFKLEDQDLESGLLALINYLVGARHKLMYKVSQEKEPEPPGTKQLMKIIDTTLVKCYLQTNDALVAPVLRRNFCHLEETERVLKRYNKWNELIILYRTKELHKNALELLQKQANISDSPLRGVEHTVQYLQNLGQEHIDLIFEFATWVLSANPKEGLKIFIDDVSEVEQLSRPKVLDYFLKTQDHDLVIQYLEHVIHAWGDNNCTLHNALIHQYKERIVQMGGEDKAHHIKTKLISFLDKSQYYQPDAVLIHFPGDGFFEERAIINGKLGRHAHALAIYACLLNNYKQALEYCEKVYSKEGGDVYLELLKLVISPPDTLPGISVPLRNKMPELNRALSLLDGHPTKIDPCRALAELPDSIHLGTLKHYLIASLQQQQQERRTAQLLRGLLTTQKLHMEEKKMELESKSFTMTEYNACPVCKKRFANLSAFVRLPNGDVIHYSCQEKLVAS